MSEQKNTLHVALDGAKCRSLRSFYPRIAKALTFQDDFGKNLDALFDALTSLDHLEAGKVVLTIRHEKQFLSLEKPDKRQAALDVLRDAQKTENRYDDKVFVVEF
jgi:RNAse (barnase) inhibitor barstar